MILECLNVVCRIPLVYLRGGRIVRTEYQFGMNLKLEHFWLCDDCSRFYNFHIFPDRPAIAILSERDGQRYVTSEQASVVTTQAAAHNCPLPYVGPAARVGLRPLTLSARADSSGTKASLVSASGV